MVRVPYFDLRQQYDGLRDEVLRAVDRVCLSTAFSSGPEVTAFEDEFAVYCGVSHCVAVNSGTSALHLALIAAGIGSGDEVITTPNTFIATAEAISYAGARPVFVDIDPGTGNIDAAAIGPAITPRTKAIIPVHLYGRPVDIDAIMAVANRHGIPLIEDACQAHGAQWRGRRVGSFGLAAAFSFYPGKNLGAYGEGGALTTNDTNLATKCRALRDHGQSERYRHEAIGFNYRMDGFQGAILRIKLRHLDQWNDRRREIASLYRAQLTSGVDTPADSSQLECAYHLFVIWADKRDALREALLSAGIQTAVHYPQPLHLQPAYHFLGYTRGSFRHAERAASRALSLPLFPEMTDRQAAIVVDVVNRIVDKAGVDA